MQSGIKPTTINANAPAFLHLSVSISIVPVKCCFTGRNAGEYVRFSGKLRALVRRTIKYCYVLLLYLLAPRRKSLTQSGTVPPARSRASKRP
jgi:hypothetical protein